LTDLFIDTLVCAYMADFYSVWCSITCCFLLSWISDGQNPKQFYDFILPEIIAELNTQAAEKDVKGSSPVIAPFYHDFIELQLFSFLVYLFIILFKTASVLYLDLKQPQFST